ncbi:TlpA disulfide reductase family protein [Marinilabiliaceae bacterium ANBcel2]|nr:TlpA disulfide reductase family protein [Marinilabiliaceae bacterium ANBcel2]
MKFRTFTYLLIVTGLVFLSSMNGSYTPGVGLSVGDKAPAIDEELDDGTFFSLDSLKGKMVLVDFWASYDGKSRIENQTKRELNKKYQNSSFYNSDSFVIVSISLDRFKTPFKNAVKRDGLDSFIHLFYSEGKDAEIAQLYGIEDEFVNFLIDGEGHIVERSSEIDKIADALKRLESVTYDDFAYRLSE